MKYINLLVFFFLGFSVICQSKTPEWVSSPANACKKSEICVVGESTGRMMSQIEARNEMAKYFSTKISSTTNITTTSKSQQIDDVISGDVFEDLVSKINETTEESLNGVEIKATYEGTDSFFALAVLNKARAAKLFRSEIKEINSKNDELFKDHRRSSYFIILKNLKVIKGLNVRYELLTGRQVRSTISLSQVMKKKREKRALNVKVKIDVEEPTKSGEIKGLVTKILLGNDYFISRGKSPFDYKVKVSVKEEKQYFNVQGFVKYKFILKAKSFKGETLLGSKEYVSIQTGRKFIKAYSNALPGMKRFIKDSFGELNID